MRRRLILMRHAKSDWSQPGLSDKDRSLNARGTKAAPLVARWLEEWLEARRCEASGDGAEIPMIDRVLCSTALRTRETLRLMQQVWGPSIQPRVEWYDDLYLAEPRVIWETFRSATNEEPGAGCVLVLGHNPGMEILVSGLAGKDIHVPTAAIAVFESEREGPIGELVPELESRTWKLQAFQTPRSLSP